jgi:sugar O-acyltransferase (sialic acid O-acetyltransferase NeuD family)
MRNIAIFGAGGFGREVKWLIEEINNAGSDWNFIGFFDDDFSKIKNIDSRFFLGGTKELNAYKNDLNVVFAIGNPSAKRKIIQQIKNPHLIYPVLIHPNVALGKKNVIIGEGSIICAGCIITIDINIGKHVILNLCCTVGHDSTIGHYSSFMPSVNISGEVILGDCLYVGTGAKIINQLEIGENTIIGAGAVVSKSLPAKCTAVGVPAKAIKFHE